MFRRPAPVLSGICAIVALAVFVTSGTSSSKEQSASINSAVEPGKVLTTRLGNLPKDAKLAIRLETSGEVRVLLINQGDFESFPDSKRPLFTGQTSDRLGFAVRVPESGSYYLIIDNRDGERTREITLSVKATADPSNTSDKIAESHEEFEKFENNLRRYFVFNELTLKFANCGTGNAFSNDDTIVLCSELGPRLRRTTGDEQMSRDVLFFILLHEVSHILFRQWGYPFHDNEEVVDEFTTMLLVMFNQSERARTQAEYFSKLSSEEELEQVRNRDVRHPLSAQRGRNIVRWLGEPDLVERWQKILVPHMQTAVLEALRQNPKQWSDADLIDQELGRRLH